jgi:hypothetical protein
MLAMRVDTPATDDVGNGLSNVRREPPIQIAPDFKTVPECKAVITTLDYGQFMLAAWLIEQMMWNSRVRGVNETRVNGLVGTPIRWLPGRDNAKARRAARDIVEDFPLIAAPATRRQITKWGINLGVAFAQKHWYRSATSGREIPRIETYHPQWAIFDWSLRAYRVWTLDGWVIVPSPALQVPGEEWRPMYAPGALEADDPRRWVVHEPFGQHSWREGLVHAAWRPWLGHEYANRDMSRSSEKLGLGIVKLKYPKSIDKTALNLLIQKIRTIGSEGVLPVEQYLEESGQASYDVEPFEFSGTGFEMIQGTKESNATDIAVLYLGHNTTAETKGASVGASAQVGNLIRGDIRVGDCENEASTLYGQVLRDWAEVNYGDPGNAPVPDYVTDPPSENQAAALTLFNVSNAVDKLRLAAPGVDYNELLNRFQIPMNAGGAQVATVPGPPAGPVKVCQSANGGDQVQPSAPADQASGEPAAAPSDASESGAESNDAAATLALTPSDLASIVKVDEGRRSIGLTPIGGDTGGKWIRKHGAELAAELPPEPAPAPAGPPMGAPPTDDEGP